MTLELTKDDFKRAEELLRAAESRHFTELWTAYGLERRKWSEDPEVIRNSPVIRFTPASPDDLERICCDSFFLPEYGALIDIGDQYSTKALIENLNALGYSLDAIHSIYLTHTHADHFGRPELFVNKDGPIPVLTSVE